MKYQGVLNPPIRQSSQVKSGVIQCPIHQYWAVVQRLLLSLLNLQSPHELLSQIIQTFDIWPIWPAPCWLLALNWRATKLNSFLRLPLAEEDQRWASDDTHHSKKLVDFHPEAQKKMFSAKKGQQPSLHFVYIL